MDTVRLGAQYPSEVWAAVQVRVTQQSINISRLIVADLRQLSEKPVICTREFCDVALINGIR